MRYSAKLLAIAVLTVGVSGCGDSGGMSEGIPKDVDMNKTYTPAATLPTMTPKDQAKAKQSAKTAPTAAPAETPN